jgi:hypothetical protein
MEQAGSDVSPTVSHGQSWSSHGQSWSLLVAQRRLNPGCQPPPFELADPCPTVNVAHRRRSVAPSQPWSLLVAQGHPKTACHNGRKSGTQDMHPGSNWHPGTVDLMGEPDRYALNLAHFGEHPLQLLANRIERHIGPERKVQVFRKPVVTKVAPLEGRPSFESQPLAQRRPR